MERNNFGMRFPMFPQTDLSVGVLAVLVLLALGQGSARPRKPRTTFVRRRGTWCMSPSPLCGESTRSRHFYTKTRWFSSDFLSKVVSLPDCLRESPEGLLRAPESLLESPRELPGELPRRAFPESFPRKDSRRAFQESLPGRLSRRASQDFQKSFPAESSRRAF